MPGDKIVEMAWSDLHPGLRVRWVTPAFAKRGVIQRVKGRSMVVLFDGHLKATVIPDARWYFAEAKNRNPEESLVVLEGRGPTRVRERGEGSSEGAMSPAEAAALLGTDPKNIRRMIRSGKLPARQEGGRWVLDRADVKRVKR